MTIRQHEQAIRFANRTGEHVGDLFARMGSADHPRGAVMKAYRQARQGLAGNLDRIGLVSSVLFTLQEQVRSAMRDVLQTAAGVGSDQAGRSLAAYGIPNAHTGSATAAGVEAVTAVVSAQVVNVQAMTAAGMADEALILGDDLRVGLLTPGPVIREGSRWIELDALGMYVASIMASLGRAGDQDGYMKQWVSAIDQKTTDCCLRANGQVQPLNKDFHLTGEPRYADYLPSPPGHWWCRSAEALVSVRDVEDELTRQMQQAGRDELDARQTTGKRKTIWPSHARSGRK